MKYFLSNILAVLVACSALSTPAHGQERGKAYSTWSAFKPERNGELFLRVENMNFFDNYEYASPHVTGSTLLGAWGRIMAEYYLDSKLRVQVGANGLKYSGKESFSEVSEWFSVVYQPNSYFRLVCGSIDVYSHNNLPEPVFNPDFLTTRPNNRGFQADLFSQTLDATAFLDWEQFILPGDNYQEVFSAGVTGNIKLYDSMAETRISFPISILGRHHGGEVDVSGQKIETLMNFSIGTRLEHTADAWKYFFNADFLYFYDVTKNFRQPIEKGYGILTEFGGKTEKLGIMLRYWHSNRYFSPLGQPIYRSYTPEKPFIFVMHDFVSARANYTLRIANIARLMVEGDYWFDTRRQKNNFYTGLKLIISEEFFVRRLKAR
jgi:hypothetical protein